MMKDFIKKHKTLSWVLGILGTLIIGGLGSGVWEIILKPFFSFMGNGIISFLINTSSSFSNEIYQNISIRGLDRFQAKIYSLFILLVGAISICSFSFTFIITRNKFKELNNLNEESIDQDYTPWFLQNKRNYNIFFIFFFLISFLPFCTYSYSSMKTEFISKKVIYFEYLIKVNGDALSEQELKKIESNFAQITKSKDYDDLINQLENIAMKNNKLINKNPL
ncbi:hypothetical protein [Acinetobacter amyesii]|uniref:Uncharacterized protein n=1 Tax=Acinetobacter amyesii TaxID=2942470 RepID=A0A1T1H0X7_9GAMM|nr:hypothetical protein [Acinetobacter amyesii]OOV83518.1 hypothetical protein B1202_07705 [Acinetobacter amyesii]